MAPPSSNPAAAVISYVEPIYDEGSKVVAAVCRLRGEGIVSKRIDVPYRAGRSEAWRKIKCARRDTMVVIGFSENSRGWIDALHLARADETGNLVYAGTLKQGFGADDLAGLEKQLRPLAPERRCWLRCPGSSGLSGFSREC